MKNQYFQLVFRDEQIFLHIYFNNAIKNDSYGGIAGYDENVAYNYCELKKLLLEKY